MGTIHAMNPQSGESGGEVGEGTRMKSDPSLLRAPMNLPSEPLTQLTREEKRKRGSLKGPRTHPQQGCGQLSAS